MSAEGDGLVLAAPGADVTFESAACAPTSLCDLSRDVAGLKAKFAPGGGGP